jgi:hypothetical protein
MANRLEHEFPAVRWQAVPSAGLDHAVVRRAIERGRQLRSEAIRRSGQAAFGAARRGLARGVAFLRCTALAVAGRASGIDCWRASLRRA